MAIPSSGDVTLSEIQTEFGGSNPISMSEYYAGGSNVPSGTTGNNGEIPSSGPLQMDDFRGSVLQSFMSASGGSVSTSGNFRIHTFTGNGTFTINTAGEGTNFAGKVDVLSVAGGGGASTLESGGDASTTCRHK